MTDTADYTFSPIGIIRSPFVEKFGIPRQPGLAPAVRAQLELLPPYNDPQALAGLEQCSHLWLQFVFHRPPSDQWRPRVRPPRLGGNRSLGVFATRSPLRPNPIGLSVVKLEAVKQESGKLWLELSGIDLLDGTPVLDIKPYVPYTDSLPEAENRFADTAPEWVEVVFTPEAEAGCRALGGRTGEDWEALVRQVLQQDPRPQYQKPDPARRYGMTLKDAEVRWFYQPDDSGNHRLIVTEVLPH
ncbi:tRNA (N6-threonylcarbamoyladenosine(37)-N6)-methyltransferase TrmO [Marinimicrobium sp. C6131]|uniref:tRNA (N6-threonylcarbamoyladenosine(37)-N6)-methyltransferase TrmO n=1 Tax=Marinimicrobium sp. C6131 TaxID=3022676 RepID=UPI00223DA5AA|nr:tRNA (N6-threonylcarbamoyladenosine(37)-N6)-methyltransferase TrmO [Marinimicrobium sp. C6131]UZJ43366.1 tRNA (N6-threonylcarbamoyladenosine(37)-N6)-methyltransferase TrmO [Marinimicrobium sp. C6131]